jgi:hypothetical protein
MFGEVPGGVLIANGWVGQEAAKTAARNALLVDLDSQIGNGTAAILEERPTRLDEGWEYNQWMLEVTLSPGTVNRVIQSTAVSRKPTGRDELGREIYVTKSLIVGCSQDCFAQEIESIRLIVDSWEVR